MFRLFKSRYLFKVELIQANYYHTPQPVQDAPWPKRMETVIVYHLLKRQLQIKRSRLVYPQDPRYPHIPVGQKIIRDGVVEYV